MQLREFTSDYYPTVSAEDVFEIVQHFSDAMRSLVKDERVRHLG